MRILIVLAAALLLSSCGFQLRGAAQLPFTTLYVQVPTASPFGNELRRNLRTTNARLVNDPTQADATLQIMAELREKLILSLGGGGRVREYQLRYRVAFRLIDGKTRELLPASEIVLKRDITFNDSEALAKEAEENLLFRDMQSDAVQQLVRRLSALKSAS
jgi:LPS-assembly lipoprotein